MFYDGKAERRSSTSCNSFIKLPIVLGWDVVMIKPLCTLMIHSKCLGIVAISVCITNFARVHCLFISLLVQIEYSGLQSMTT